MEFTSHTLVLLPIGLGLLGFVEPCTVGGHLVFLDTQTARGRSHRIGAALTFAVTRSVVSGLFGALIAFVGQNVIAAQTGAWVVFGILYVLVGVAFLSGRAGLFKHSIDLAPNAWKRMQSPLVLGLAFGLNIPACAAPILFGLLGLAATTGTISAGFTMMFLFGFALSAPLIVFALLPSLSVWLTQAGLWMKSKAWLTGLIFILLGLWSIWFGLYVDPQNWSGR